MSSNLKPRSNFGAAEIDHRKALLEVADLMVQQRSLPEFLAALAERLGTVAASEFFNLYLHDPARNVMRLHIPESKDLASAPIEVPVMDSPGGFAWQTQKPLVVSKVTAETRFPSLMNLLKDKGIRSYCALPLTTPEKRVGALGLGSSRASAYSEKNLRLLRRVAQLVAYAVEKVLTREALEQEKKRLQVLLEVNTTLVSTRDLGKLLPKISGFIRRVIRYDYGSVAVCDEAAHELSLYPLDPVLTQDPVGTDTTVPVKEAPAGHVLLLERETKIFGREDLVGIRSGFVSQMLEQGVQSLCCVPLVMRNGTLGTLNLASREHNAFIAQDLDFLKQVAAQLAVALDNARAYLEIAELKDKLGEKQLYLVDEIRSEQKTYLEENREREEEFREIVGESPALGQALAQAQAVAATDTTVLILGETGTGKELMARAIHRMSGRKERNFLTINCAAIPAELLETELFGQEKGSFPEARAHKIGVLELAYGGTLLLDEIGDLPLELQPKLLRVLQEGEFERVGSTRTIGANVRLMAATNRDLTKKAAEGRFRSDLFYRLNVFSVRMPALRERREDIPQLVRHFVRKFSRLMGKSIETIPNELMEGLQRWDWPGNVRELEHFVQMSVITTPGTVLRGSLPQLQELASGTVEHKLEEVERDYILQALRGTRGKISGMNGAATKLGMKRTTLQSRMRKLKIERSEYVL